jgi:hypothetical protein
MNFNNYDHITSNRIVRVVGAILGTLILGALGSGFWELLLRDVILGLGNITLSLISTVWGGYVDLLHRDIGKLRSDQLVAPIFVVFMLAVITGPLFYVLIFLRRISYLVKSAAEDGDDHQPMTREQFLERMKVTRRQIVQQMVPLTIVSAFLYSVLFWQISYTRNAGVWAERSIEILRPHISTLEHDKLRSDLRAVEGAQRFYSLEARLHELAKTPAITLPTFTVIRKRNAP